ncbi:MAG TPA: response regulator [Nitrospiraceae bacterium]|nr:response regulator [Nitrospiraceae bacterium]
MMEKELDVKAGAGEPIRLLVVEDESPDVELLIRELARAGYAPDWRRVDTEASFLEALETPLDVIVSDNAMPSFSASRALELLKERGMRIPFIVVSRAIGEEQAVALIREGADDYVMKDRLGRIGAAVHQVLDQARLRREHAKSQDALRRLNEELEHRIAQRTNELKIANEALERELRDRARAEDELRRLTNELETRVATRTADLVQSQARLRALASELVLTEQRERRRLATDMHDYLAQLLVLARLKLSQTQPRVTEPSTSELLAQAQDALKQALTYTRTLVAGLTPPVLREFGLSAALTWLGEHMQPHGLSVTVTIEHECPPLPEDRAVLLFQSVRELLMNVAKHAQTDRAAVLVSVTPDGTLRIVVEDQGRGFEADAADRPSDQFGLFSIRERMQVMGGTLEINSAPGRGTKATLLLPLTPRPAAAATAETAHAESGARRDVVTENRELLKEAGDHESGRFSFHIPRSSSQQQATIRVLLADDHAMVRQGLRSVLEGYRDLQVIGEAQDGMEAVELAQALRPDVIVMDVNMPRLDGIQATCRVKHRHPETVVIGLSVNRARQVEEAMQQAGASAFLTKESVADQLYQAIQRTRVRATQ